MEYKDTANQDVVKNLTWDEIWSEHTFISRGNPDHTSWFCNVEFGSTQTLRWYHR